MFSTPISVGVDTYNSETIYDYWKNVVTQIVEIGWPEFQGETALALEPLYLHILPVPGAAKNHTYFHIKLNGIHLYKCTSLVQHLTSV